MNYVSLFDEPMVVAFPTGHELESYDAIPLAEVLRYQYVERLHCEFRQETYEFSKGRDVEMRVVFRSEREDWIQGLVQDGAGVTVIPRYSLLQSELDFRPVTDPVLTRSVELAVLKDAEVSPALERLISEASAYPWPLEIR